MPPKILFHKAGNFSITDFPIDRVGPLWKDFPAHLTGQAVDYDTITPISYQFPHVVKREDTPSREAHQNIVLQMQPLELKKTVVARLTTLTFSEDLDPLGVFFYLKERSSGSWPFAIILSPTLAFVGSTPELLYKRTKNHLSTMALAGTRPHALENELLSCKTCRLEFQFVKDFITNQLREICEPFEVSDEVFIKRTHNLSHLYYPFEVTLKNGVSDGEILQRLHPTPAIAGYPRLDALSKIASCESFDRGWYCGTLEYSNTLTKEVYVALRCAQIKENKLHIFAGGGIVKNSDPQNEWEELENKIQTFLITG